VSLIHWQQFLWLFLPQRGLSGCYLGNLKNSHKTCGQLTHGYRARNPSLVCIILHPDCNYYRPAKSACSMTQRLFTLSPPLSLLQIKMDAYSISHTSPSRRSSSRIYQDLAAWHLSYGSYSQDCQDSRIMNCTREVSCFHFLQIVAKILKLSILIYMHAIIY